MSHPISHPMMALDDVSVAYGKVEAVRGVSLAIPAGRIVTVIGANGAGKTTLLNAAMGLLPSRGRHRLRWPRARGPRHRGARRPGPRPGAGAARAVRLNDGGRQPRSRRLPPPWRRARIGSGTSLRPVPPPERARDPARRHFVGRRAPDAGHGPRPDGPPAPADAGRAKPWLGAPHRPRHLRDHRRPQGHRRVDPPGRAERPRRPQVADYAYVMELGEISAEGPASQLAADPRIVESYLGLGA